MSFKNITHNYNIYKQGRKSRLACFANANIQYLLDKDDELSCAVLGNILQEIKANDCKENWQGDKDIAILIKLIRIYIDADFRSGWLTLQAFYNSQTHDITLNVGNRFIILELGIVYSYIKKLHEHNPGNRETSRLLENLLRKLVRYRLYLSLTMIQECIDICEAIEIYDVREAFAAAFNKIFTHSMVVNAETFHLDIASLCCSAFGHQVMYPLAWSCFFQLSSSDLEISCTNIREITVLLNQHIHNTPSGIIESLLVRPSFKDLRVKYLDLTNDNDLDPFGYESLPCSAWSIRGEYLDRHTGPGYLWYMHEIKELHKTSHSSSYIPKLMLNKNGFEDNLWCYLGEATKDIVAIHIKTGAYKGIDQSHRSFELTEYAQLLKYISQRYHVVIIGEEGVYETITSINGSSSNIHSIKTIFNQLRSEKFNSIQEFELYILECANFFVTSYSGNSQLAKLLRKPALLLGGPSRGVLYDPFIMQVATDYEELRVINCKREHITAYLSTTPGGSIECNKKTVKKIQNQKLLISAFELYTQRVNNWNSQFSNNTFVGPFSVAKINNASKSLEKLIMSCHKQRIKDWIYLSSI